MVTQDVTKPEDRHLTGGYIYALAVLTSATGAFLATCRLLVNLRLPTVFLLFARTLILGSVILGYDGNSFLAGVSTSILPWIGYHAFIWTWPPFDATPIEGMIAGASFGMVWALPLASLLFIVGVGLRRDGTLTEQKHSLILRPAFALLVSVAIGLALDRGLLRVHGDQ